MTKYDFSTLSSYDFEILTKDLLQKELNITLESFKSGKDKGIDLRYSKEKKQHGLVVQCKHYVKTGLQGLLSHLKKSESKKLPALKLERYIFVTSVPLSAENKNKIIEIFAPYIHSPRDIYGADDLNNLLGKFPEVETAHFKLWLSSVNILERILHSDVLNQSEMRMSLIQQKMKLYVQTDSFSQALKKIKEHRYCIISGNAGIGKTTLAEMIILYYIGQDYEFIEIRSDLTEAIRVFKNHKKQIFYYDDFLGQTYLGDAVTKNEDASIVSFIDSVRLSSNHVFVLTTREYILKQSQKFSEKIAQSQIEISKCILELGQYSKMDKAKILYNHLYFYNVKHEDIESIIAKKNYHKIITHKNYNPRIVEWMTSKFDDNEGGYFESFIKNLDQPGRLWSHTFSRKISHGAQVLILVLATLPNRVVFEDLEKAFYKLYDAFCTKFHKERFPNDFLDAIKEAEGSFVRTDLENGVRTMNFHNPSINDFIEEYINLNLEIFKLLLENSVFPYQLTRIIGIFNKNNKIKNFPEDAVSFVELFNSWDKVKYQDGPRFGQYRHKISSSYESVALELFTIVLTHTPNREVCVKTLKEIELRIDNKIADKAALGDSLKAVSKNIKRGNEFHRILTKAKNYIFDDLSTPFGLAYLDSLLTAFPDFFADQLPEISKDVEIATKHIAEDLISSTDETWYYHHCIEILNRLSVSSKANLKIFISSLHKKVTSIQESPEDREEENDFKKDEDNSEEDIAIEDLFDSLSLDQESE